MDRLMLVGRRKDRKKVKCLPIGDCLPIWSKLPLDAKLPMMGHPNGSVIFCTTKLGDPLHRSKQKYDFDLRDPNGQYYHGEYSPLQDPYLKSYFSSRKMIRHLIRQGFLSEDGKVLCSLEEFNYYREYLRHQCLLKIAKGRHERGRSPKHISRKRRKSNLSICESRGAIVRDRKQQRRACELQLLKSQIQEKLDGLNKRLREIKSQTKARVKKQRVKRKNKMIAVKMQQEKDAAQGRALRRKLRFREEMKSRLLEERELQRRFQSEQENEDRYCLRIQIQKKMSDEEGKILKKEEEKKRRSTEKRARKAHNQRRNLDRKIETYKIQTREEKERREEQYRQKLEGKLARIKKRRPPSTLGRRRRTSKFRSTWKLRDILKTMIMTDLSPRIGNMVRQPSFLAILDAAIDKAVEGVMTPADKVLPRTELEEKTKLIEQPMGIVEDVIPIPAVQETSTDDDEEEERLREQASEIVQDDSSSVKSEEERLIEQAKEIVEDVIRKVKTETYPAYLKMLEEEKEKAKAEEEDERLREQANEIVQDVIFRVQHEIYPAYLKMLEEEQAKTEVLQNIDESQKISEEIAEPWAVGSSSSTMAKSMVDFTLNKLLDEIRAGKLPEPRTTAITINVVGVEADEDDEEEILDSEAVEKTGTSEVTDTEPVGEMDETFEGEVEQEVSVGEEEEISSEGGEIADNEEDEGDEEEEEDIPAGSDEGVEEGESEVETDSEADDEEEGIEGENEADISESDKEIPENVDSEQLSRAYNERQITGGRTSESGGNISDVEVAEEEIGGNEEEGESFEGEEEEGTSEAEEIEEEEETIESGDTEDISERSGKGKMPKSGNIGKYSDGNKGGNAIEESSDDEEDISESEAKETSSGEVSEKLVSEEEIDDYYAKVSEDKNEEISEAYKGDEIQEDDIETDSEISGQEFESSTHDRNTNSSVFGLLFDDFMLTTLQNLTNTIEEDVLTKDQIQSLLKTLADDATYVLTTDLDNVHEQNDLEVLHDLMRKLQSGDIALDALYQIVFMIASAYDMHNPLPGKVSTVTKELEDLSLESDEKTQNIVPNKKGMKHDMYPKSKVGEMASPESNDIWKLVPKTPQTDVTNIQDKTILYDDSLATLRDDIAERVADIVDSGNAKSVADVNNAFQCVIHDMKRKFSSRLIQKNKRKNFMCATEFGCMILDFIESAFCGVSSKSLCYGLQQGRKDKIQQIAIESVKQTIKHIKDNKLDEEDMRSIRHCLSTLTKPEHQSSRITQRDMIDFLEKEIVRIENDGLDNRTLSRCSAQIEYFVGDLLPLQRKNDENLLSGDSIEAASANSTQALLCSLLLDILAKLTETYEADLDDGNQENTLTNPIRRAQPFINATSEVNYHHHRKHVSANKDSEYLTSHAEKQKKSRHRRKTSASSDLIQNSENMDSSGFSACEADFNDSNQENTLTNPIRRVQPFINAASEVNYHNHRKHISTHKDSDYSATNAEEQKKSRHRRKQSASFDRVKNLEKTDSNGFSSSDIHLPDNFRNAGTNQTLDFKYSQDRAIGKVPMGDTIIRPGTRNDTEKPVSDRAANEQQRITGKPPKYPKPRAKKTALNDLLEVLLRTSEPDYKNRKSEDATSPVYRWKLKYNPRTRHFKLEPSHEKTNNLHMRTQRRRSAPLFSLH